MPPHKLLSMSLTPLHPRRRLTRPKTANPNPLEIGTYARDEWGFRTRDDEIDTVLLCVGDETGEIVDRDVEVEDLAVVVFGGGDGGSAVAGTDVDDVDGRRAGE